MTPAHTSGTSLLEHPFPYYLRANFRIPQAEVYCNKHYGASCSLTAHDTVLQSGTQEDTFVRNIRGQFHQVSVDYMPRQTASHPKTKAFKTTEVRTWNVTEMSETNTLQGPRTEPSLISFIRTF